MQDEVLRKALELLGDPYTRKVQVRDIRSNSWRPVSAQVFDGDDIIHLASNKDRPYQRAQKDPAWMPVLAAVLGHERLHTEGKGEPEAYARTVEILNRLLTGKVPKDIRKFRESVEQQNLQLAIAGKQ